MIRRVLFVLFTAAVTLGTACSPRLMGINRMADALSATAGAYSRDDDPEFVRVAAPSTLKMVEMLLEDRPSHVGLLMTACSGFTQYAYGFLHVDAEMAEPTNAAAAKELQARAARMYDRAREYCLRALELRHSGVRAALTSDAASALRTMTNSDVPALYWTAVSLAASVSLAENQLVRLGDLAAVRAMLSRSLALDEAWEHGALHEAFIAVEGLPPVFAGSAARARQHFERAVELSGGRSAFAYVSMASSVSLPAKNRAEFQQLLQKALAIDAGRTPELRLQNLIAQKRARFLLSRIDRLF